MSTLLEQVQTDYGARQQAIKGLIITLSGLTCEYARKLPQDVFNRLPGMPRASAEIAEATAKLNHFATCLVAREQFRALKRIAETALDDHARSNGYAGDFALLSAFAQEPIWNLEEARAMFARCFRILNTFGDEYRDLIDEVRRNFPEESDGI